MPSKKARHKKQTRLNFSPLPSSSPQRPEDHLRLNDATIPRKRQRVGASTSDPDVRELSSEVEEAIEMSKQAKFSVVVDSQLERIDQLPTPTNSSQIEQAANESPKVQRRGGANVSKPLLGGSSTFSIIKTHDQPVLNSEEEGPVRSSGRNRPAFAMMDTTSDDSEPITPTVRRNQKRGDLDASSSSSEPPSRPTPSRAPTARSFLAGGTTGNAPIPRSQRRSLQLTQDLSVIDRQSTSDSETEKTQTIANSTRRLRSTTNRQRNPEPIAGIDGGESSSDDILISPARRRANQTNSGRHSEEDEDSMLEELGAAEYEEEPQRRRTRGKQNNSVRSKRLDRLAKLKQRRAGMVQAVDSEDDWDENGDNNFEDDDNDEREPIEDNPTLKEERPDKTWDDYDSDFVEDDGEIGIDLMKHGVPLRFTGQANKKPFDYFKDEIEWMIHNKLDPAFERHDEIYELAHRKLNDEVLGLAGSEFNSSVWRENFTKALKTRPEFFTTEVGMNEMEPKCEACNRSKHPPKWMITFSGPTYDRMSLEKVSKKDSDDYSSSSEDESDEVEEEEVRWHVGSVCCGNAEIAHTLYHWRYQLNATVLQWLSINGYTAPARIVERENWTRKKREKLANKVVDGMLESGEMRSLYQQFKQNLDAARAAKTERVER